MIGFSLWHAKTSLGNHLEVDLSFKHRGLIEALSIT
jgi:hypothetical protein